MGYLSQKKHETRKNIFLWSMVVLLAVLTAVSIMNEGFHLGFFNLFHIYCLSLLIFIYALFTRKYKAACAFAVILLINYTSLAANTNIFLSEKFDGSKELSLTFNPEQKFTESFALDDIKAAGNIILAQKYIASFIVVGNETPITLVRVNFHKAKKKDYALIFNHLHEFLLKQDNPVVIFGNFGIPAWNRHFKSFLQTSGLTVKNRLLFLDGNFLKPSDFYVLGFSEMGVSQISNEPGKAQNVVLVKISFNPAQI